MSKGTFIIGALDTSVPHIATGQSQYTPTQCVELIKAFKSPEPWLITLYQSRENYTKCQRTCSRSDTLTAINAIAAQATYSGSPLRNTILLLSWTMRELSTSSTVSLKLGVVSENLLIVLFVLRLRRGFSKAKALLSRRSRSNLCLFLYIHKPTLNQTMLVKIDAFFKDLFYMLDCILRQGR